MVWVVLRVLVFVLFCVCRLVFCFSSNFRMLSWVNIVVNIRVVWFVGLWFFMFILWLSSSCIIGSLFLKVVVCSGVWFMLLVIEVLVLCLSSS